MNLAGPETTVVDNPPPTGGVAAGPNSADSAISWQDRLHRHLHPRRAWWQQARRIGRTILGWVPITPLGIVALVGLSQAFDAYSGEQTDLIICTVCVGSLAICVLDILCVVAAGLWFRFRREDPPDEEPLRLDVGIATHTGYSLGRVGLLPCLQITTRWPAPLDVDAELVADRSGQREVVRAQGRGWADQIVREITIRDWFGLSRVRLRRLRERAVRILPAAGRTAMFELVEQLRPGDILGHPEGQPLGDLVEMRRYAAGDPLKLVLWKAYARTGKLLVRTPERAVAPTDRMLAYFVPAPGDEASAGIARAALEGRLLGDEVVFLAEGAVDPASSTVEAVDQVMRSVAHRDAGGEGLDRFLVRGENSGTSAAFLFVSPQTGPWLNHVCDVMATHPGPFQIIIGVDHIESERQSTGWRRYIFEPRSKAATSEGRLRALRKRLEAAGAQVRVLDRESGREVSL